jgi:uncharacterized protein
MKRALEARILADLGKKMVFLTGPRQVGKTHLAREIMGAFKSPVYLNHDHAPSRAIIENEEWLEQTDLLVLDEIHKMKDWTGYLKGVYDTRPAHRKILVTGSARLDFLSHGGESLAGRYFRHRLLPLTPRETGSTDLARFLARGGFPEPWLADSDDDAARWRLQYAEGIVRHDALDFGRVHDVRAMDTLLQMLRARVGSSLSFASLARDLQISPHTVQRYVEIFEALYIVFRVTPHAHNVARALQQTPKLYFYDVGMAEGDGPRFENLVALCLLKHCWATEDLHGSPLALRYLRNRQGKEADFCLVQNRKPLLMVEAKVADHEPDPNLRYFAERTKIPAVQCVRDLRQEYRRDGIDVRKADRFLMELEA